MRSRQYSPDVLAEARRPKRVVETRPADRGLVVEEVSTGFCGAVVECDKERVSLEDRHGKVRVFPLSPAAFLLDGVAVTLVRPVGPAPPRATRTASGSVAHTSDELNPGNEVKSWVRGGVPSSTTTALPSAL